MVKPGERSYYEVREALGNRETVLCASHGDEVFLYDDGSIQCIMCTSKGPQEENTISSTWTREQIIDLIDEHLAVNLEVVGHINVTGGNKSE